MKRAFFLGIAACAAAAGSLLEAPAAHAGCLSSSSTINCSTFEGSTISNVQAFAYNDGDFVDGEKITQISFNSGPQLTGSYPFTITDIAYSFDGGTTWLTNNLTTTATLTSANQTGINLLSADVNVPGGGTIGTNNFRLKYTLPVNTYTVLGNTQAYIQSFVASNTLANDLPQTQTRNSRVLATPVTPAPSPLPLLGASAAFGFSRRMRNRIRIAA